MKNLPIFMSVIFLICSCSNSKTKNDSLTAQITADTIKKVKPKETEPIKEIDTETTETISYSKITNGPCKELQEFVVEIEALNWVFDTERLKEVASYRDIDRNEIEYFNERPFYPVSFEDSRLKKLYKSGIYSDDFDSIAYEMFEAVDNIWSYYYREKEESNLISDGVIEQWEFRSVDEAEKALKQIRRIGNDIYFNTMPYFCRIRNKMIIFRTRAMAFSFDQKHVFEKFVEENITDR